MRPSFINSLITGILLTISTIMFIYNYEAFDTSTTLILLFLMTIAFGVHSIEHYFEEIYFDFNPLVNKWAINDIPRKNM